MVGRCSKSRWARRWWGTLRGGLDTFEGHEQLVALDHGNPEVAQYVGDVVRFWSDRGVDAWRLDVAYAVPPEFWRDALPRDRDTWYFGEMIHGDYAGYVEKSGLDSVTQYELWKAIWSSLNDRNFYELSYALGRHNALLDTFVPQTFVGNHDVTRLATRLEDERHLGHALATAPARRAPPGPVADEEQRFPLDGTPPVPAPSWELLTSP